MNQRRKFLKQVGAVFAGVAAAVYCPAVLGELFKKPGEYIRLGFRFNENQSEVIMNVNGEEFRQQIVPAECWGEPVVMVVKSARSNWKMDWIKG